ARIVDRVEASGPTLARDRIAELIVGEMVGQVTDVAADDRRVADLGVDPQQAGEPLRPAASGLDVAIGLPSLIVELTPDMDRRGRPALEHRAGKRRDL